MEGLSPLHVIVILVIALIIIGPGKLPETGAALGRAIRDFRRAMSDEATPAATGGPKGSAAGGDPTPPTSPAQTPPSTPPTDPPASAP